MENVRVESLPDGESASDASTCTTGVRIVASSLTSCKIK